MLPKPDNTSLDSEFNLKIVPPIVGIMLTGATSLALSLVLFLSN